MLRLALLLTATQVLSAATVEVAGNRVYYEIGGQGKPVLVLIHGATCDLTFWRLNRPEFEKHFRVLAVDLPGHGKSDKPEGRYDLRRFADGVHGAMRAEGISRAIIVGHSLGAAVARQLLVDHPDAVAGLVSVDGSVFKAPKDEASLKRMEQFVASMRGPEAAEISGKFIEQMMSPATTPELREEIRRKMLLTPSYVSASAFEAAIMGDVFGKAGPTDVPTLAINARKGMPGREALHRELFTKLTYLEWDGVGHFLMMEKPAELNETVIGWVHGLQKPKP